MNALLLYTVNTEIIECIYYFDLEKKQNWLLWIQENLHTEICLRYQNESSNYYNTRIIRININFAIISELTIYSFDSKDSN